MRASKLIRDNMRADAPGAAAERIAFREDAEQAVRERQEKFGAVTIENFQAASDWQEARIVELQRAREGSK